MFHRAHRKSFSLKHVQEPHPQPYLIQQPQPKTLSEKLTYPLIRPPRFTYNQQLLIPPITKNGIMEYSQVLIPFKLSIYKPRNMRYIILYLHGNSASRFEGHSMLTSLPKEAGLACFDFSACGNRKDSEFVTLGQNQSKDVDIAAKYLKDQGYLVAGWGRSMGAVSLLLSSEIDVLVVDSPYNSLPTLIKQTVQEHFPRICCCFLNCLFPCVFSWVKSGVQEKSGLKIDDMEISERIKQNIKTRFRKIFFIVGSEDKTISPEHTKLLYKNFSGVKKLRVFDGTHNSVRPKHLIGECHDFIEHHLLIENPESMGALSPTRLLKKNSSSTRLVKVNASTKPIKTEAIQIQQENQKADQTLEIQKTESNTCFMKQKTQSLQKFEPNLVQQSSLKILKADFSIKTERNTAFKIENCEQSDVLDEPTQINEIASKVQ